MTFRKAAQHAAAVSLMFGMPVHVAAETGTVLGSHPEQPAFLGELTMPSSENPYDRAFGWTDPVRRSLGTTEALANDFREQQHRFQANGDRRELRGRRPEPGEVEVTREDATMPIQDPLRRTLRSLVPRTP
jgi:hypothetical protein